MTQPSQLNKQKLLLLPPNGGRAVLERTPSGNGRPVEGFEVGSLSLAREMTHWQRNQPGELLLAKKEKKSPLNKENARVDVYINTFRTPVTSEQKTIQKLAPIQKLRFRNLRF